MRHKTLAYIAVFFIVQTSLLFAQSDSSNVELGLDFLIGRIIQGYGWEIPTQYSKEKVDVKGGFDRNPFEIKGTMFCTPPGLLYSKSDLFSIHVTDEIYSLSRTYGSVDPYKSKRNAPQLTAVFRPGNSLQLFLSNEYQFTDLTTSFKGKVKNNLFNFGIRFLSNGGTVKYQMHHAKWWYYIFSPQLNLLAPTSDQILFLNPKQFYLLADIKYNYLKDNFKGRWSESSGYSTDKLNNAFISAHFSLSNDIFLKQDFYYEGNKRYIDQKGTRTVYNENREPEYVERYNFIWDASLRNYNYLCDIFLLNTKDIAHRLKFSLEEIRSQDYEKDIRGGIDTSNYADKTHGKSWRRGLRYEFHFLKSEKEIPLLQILSDYYDYYGHQLPKKSINILSAISYKTYKEDWRVPFFFRLKPDTTKNLNLFSKLSYGLTNKFEPLLQINLIRSMNKEPFANIYFPGAPNINNSTDIISKVGFSYYNYLFDANKSEQVNWLNLSDFDYWQGSLLRRGMWFTKLQIRWLQYNTLWYSEKSTFFNFHWSKLNFARQIYIDLKSAIGLRKNLQLDFRLTYSKPDQILYLFKTDLESQYSLQNMPFSNKFFEYGLGLQWQCLYKGRIKLSYSYHRDWFPEYFQEVQAIHKVNAGFNILF